MPRILDGLAGMAPSIMGDMVRFTSSTAPVRNINSIFRRTPVEVLNEDGKAVLLDMPWWRVNKGALDPMPRTGDRIEPGDGQTYAIVSQHSSGSPAQDAFVIYALERIS